jgi:hypothetical protein
MNLKKRGKDKRNRIHQTNLSLSLNIYNNSKNER